jgi:hypothetical protein
MFMSTRVAGPALFARPALQAPTSNARIIIIIIIIIVAVVVVVVGKRSCRPDYSR